MAAEHGAPLHPMGKGGTRGQGRDLQGKERCCRGEGGIRGYGLGASGDIVHTPHPPCTT